MMTSDGNMHAKYHEVKLAYVCRCGHMISKFPGGEGASETVGLGKEQVMSVDSILGQQGWL